MNIDKNSTALLIHEKVQILDFYVKLFLQDYQKGRDMLIKDEGRNF